MTRDAPPSIDPLAAARWSAWRPGAADAGEAASPWLHEEVGRRMAERLEWIRAQPLTWVDWHPLRGGLEAHRRVAARYPKARCWVVEAHPSRLAVARSVLEPAWWHLDRWRGLAPTFGDPPAGQAQLLWSNMGLHVASDPRAWIEAWHRSLAVDGFLMFSCLGPDTLRTLADVYRAQGWAPPQHAFTDMHDWGDMLVQAGFGEPVMDMERITLSFSSAAALRAELRGLGRNLSRDRDGRTRSRSWLRTWDDRVESALRNEASEGRLELEFEVIYGHALRPPARMAVASESTLSLDDMRSALRRGRSEPGLR